MKVSAINDISRVRYFKKQPLHSYITGTDVYLSDPLDMCCSCFLVAEIFSMGTKILRRFERFERFDTVGFYYHCYYHIASSNSRLLVVLAVNIYSTTELAVFKNQSSLRNLQVFRGLHNTAGGIS